jgi:putative addiction module CopG family antidote
MNVVLSPQAEKIVRQQVEAGLYHDASEVVDEALTLLNDPHRFAAFKAAVDQGFAELDRGEGILLTPELFEDIRRTARKLAREGHTPDPDVCP